MNKQSKDFLRLVIDHDESTPRIEGLYLVTDEGERLVERVRSALSGGVAVLQYRCKKNSPEEKVALGRELRALCVDAGIPFIVNDDPHLALELDADGVHLGQEDTSPFAARQILGPKKIVGVSTHTVREARQAEADGADYIGFGAMYPTGSKTVTHLPGPAALREVKGSVGIPVVAIGGIKRDNALSVMDGGADAVAVISSVLGDPNPAVAAAELALLFNRRLPPPRGTVLTVAGSDSGGGAGIQADLKTVTLLGAYGASAITALTAQNTRGVTGICPVPPSFVEEQITAVLSDIPVDVVKTGMLHSADIAATVAEVLERFGKRILVIDPVMLAKGGARLVDRPAVTAIREHLFPLTYLLTPNIPEAEQLTGVTIHDEAGMEEAARALHAQGVRNVLLKGGHLTEGAAVDLLFDGTGFMRFPTRRIMTKNTHGTGCTLASAIAAFLARGEPLPAAVGRAKEFITTAIRLAHPLGRGHGPVNHYLAAQEQLEHEKKLEEQP
ncbi:bifunctional hydroxymethylpyrimidine kinase/phosphomethylpyrimidine kinase [Geobacter sp. DSM 9736]|uniref:bifunctional hydroxymethylpyrimidine kinase/phosphomethylpyrimidine kinase n=1 Tax=Geobacter sp. DSM 9736 TaxID=1277350 RepID=UPI000B504267|nr:bifunctional hydroxymethylpyrimidine kinase/phosphomethylpyrimidine kinase [Geobacter sp. DSM 9736]SNB46660.1 hydroxymethylpyrimidine kinase / phosphomethylpyrimidine kinase / thiamine-phosphate diphosphorylase [Geobacter sp. DSM 9736]